VLFACHPADNDARSDSSSAGQQPWGVHRASLITARNRATRAGSHGRGPSTRSSKGHGSFAWSTRRWSIAHQTSCRQGRRPSVQVFAKYRRLVIAKASARATMRCLQTPQKSLRDQPGRIAVRALRVPQAGLHLCSRSAAAKAQSI
jgi:hypothetical protein